MRRRRVAYFIPTLAPGGTERQLLYLAEGMMAEYDVAVVCTSRPGPWAERLPTACHQESLDCRGGWDPRMEARARRAIASFEPDIVHTFLFGFDYAVNAAARRAGVPVVISSRRQLATWKRPRHIRAQRRANRLVDAVVANGSAAAEFARHQEHGPDDLYHVIPNGIEPSAFQYDGTVREARAELGLALDRPLVGMVANFSPVKDHELFARVAAAVAKSHPDCRFLLVGDGDLQSKIARQLSESGLARRVSIRSSVSDPAACYRAMTVSMLTSRVEGFPNVALESMAAGLPFVGPAVGGIPEIVREGESGLLVKGRVPKNFAAAIGSLLDDPALAESMGRAGAERVCAEYSIDSLWKAHASLYEKLLQRAEAREEAV